MMAAAMAFTFQAAFIPTSATAAGENGHFSYKRLTKSHVVTHVHADGTIHRHAVDDGDRALDNHLQEPGCPCCWNMAVVAGVLPSLGVCAVEAILIGKLAIEELDPYRGTEPDGPRRPPRPPCIA
jgi:hypothetical protein